MHGPAPSWRDLLNGAGRKRAQGVRRHGATRVRARRGTNSQRTTKPSDDFKRDAVIAGQRSRSRVPLRRPDPNPENLSFRCAREMGALNFPWRHSLSCVRNRA